MKTKITTYLKGILAISIGMAAYWGIGDSFIEMLVGLSGIYLFIFSISVSISIIYFLKNLKDLDVEITSKDSFIIKLHGRNTVTEMEVNCSNRDYQSILSSVTYCALVIATCWWLFIFGMSLVAWSLIVTNVFLGISLCYLNLVSRTMLDLAYGDEDDT